MIPLVRPVLESLRSTVLHLRRFPTADVASQMLFSELERSVQRLLGEIGGSITFSFTGDGLWFGGELLLHETLEFADLGRQVVARGIETITIDPTPTRVAVIALSQFIAGTSGEIPDGGGVRINEEASPPPPIEPGSHGPGLRRAYLAGIEALKGAVFGSRTGEGIDLDQVKWVADRLVVASSGRPTATALLATMRNPTEYLYHHSVNTALLAVEVGRQAGMRVADLRALAIGALLHDVGKAIVVPEVVDDPGRLGPEQWDRLRSYPAASALAVLQAGTHGAEVAAVMGLEHNVRHDGTGYPQLPEGRHQHPAAALLAVVDVYDAMTSRRPYRRAETNGTALRILVAGAGTQFHPGVVRLFLDRFGPVPPGSCFRLAAGEVFVGAAGSDQGVRGLIVQDRNGDVLPVPRPVLVPYSAIDGELSVLEAGVRPAAYLDQLETVEQRAMQAKRRSEADGGT